MNTFFLSLSSLQLALLLAITFIFIGQVLLYIVQKHIQKKYLVGWGTYDGFASTLGGIFSIILAFVTISVWQSHAAVNNLVGKEANAIYNIYRTVDAYSPVERREAREKLKEYIEEVVETEWSFMEQRIPDKKALEKLKSFHDLIIHIEPKNNTELSAHQEVLRLMSEYRELRRNRVMTTEPLIGDILWVVLICNLLVFAIALCFVEVDNYLVHSMQLALCSLVISAIFSLLILYNYPFLGPEAVTVKPFKSILEVYVPLH